MNWRWYGQQGYLQWCTPQGYPLQGYPPQYGGFAQEDYSNNPYGYPAQGYNYPYAQPCPPEDYSNNPYGYPAQGYNYPYAQPPQWMNHGPQNTYTQIGGGQYNPQVQEVGKIATKGDFNMGNKITTSRGATNNFNNQGSYAEKQIQGVNGGFVQM